MNEKKNYRVMCVKYGFTTIEAESEEEALETAKNMTDHEYDWSDSDDHQVVEEGDY